MFERFLSPQRSEMPDMWPDMDFDRRRLELLSVRQIYGYEACLHVITYSRPSVNELRDGACHAFWLPFYMGLASLR